MKSPSPQLLRALRNSLSNEITQLPHRPHQTALRPVACRNTLRQFSTTSPVNASPRSKPAKPTNAKLLTKDRGPRSEEDTQTDFRILDIYSNTIPPATTIDACLDDGFHLNNGLKITGGDGVLLLGGEAFSWRPWAAIDPSNPGVLLAKTGAVDLSSEQMFGLISLLNPLPDLVILGTGATTRPLTKQTRELIASLGVKVDIMDTNNAAASFNLLSTERGTEGVAAAMLPISWKR